MQQIADWLQKLGLGQYAQRFAENGIDVSVLRYLTDQDLEKIGVLLAKNAGSDCRAYWRRSRHVSARHPAPKEATARRGASPAHRHVHRPRRLDCALDKARSRRSAFGNRRLSQERRGYRRPV